MITSESIPIQYIPSQFLFLKRQKSFRTSLHLARAYRLFSDNSQLRKCMRTNGPSCVPKACPCPSLQMIGVITNLYLGKDTTPNIFKLFSFSLSFIE